MSPFRMSKIEEAMRTVLAFNQAFNRHDLAGMMEMVSVDCVFESADPAPDGARYTGKDAIQQYWQAFFHEQPQAHIKIEDTFGFGDRCILHWRYEESGLDGKNVHMRGVDIVKVKNGVISELLSYVKGSCVFQ